MIIIGTVFRTIAKTWMQSKNGMHGDVYDFGCCVLKDHSYDLTNIIKVLRHAPVPPESVACIQQIINRSLYMGEIANRCLMRIKKFSEEKAKSTVPEFCIYTAYTFALILTRNSKPKTLNLLPQLIIVQGSGLRIRRGVGSTGKTSIFC